MRVVGHCKHKLSDILVIALATYLCGGQDYSEMQGLAEERGEALRPLVELPNGIPNVDTFERVLGRIDPASLLSCLNVYGQELIGELKGKHIALDGKTIRGSKRKNGSTRILSAWVSEYGFSLSQSAISEKSNEIDSIPEVLDSLEFHGAIVTIDAMGTQTAIARKIVDAEADYILCLKGNQKILLEDTRDAFTAQLKKEVHTSLDCDHGRVEERIYTAVSAEEALLDVGPYGWKGLNSLIQVQRKVFDKSKGTESVDNQYYI